VEADTKQLFELARFWPGIIREGFFVAYRLLVNADWVHFGLLGLALPRHASLWVEGFACLERSRLTERQPIAAAERYLMTARDNQPFRWGDEDFTCAHRAVLSLASRIANLSSRAMSPGVIVIPDIPETNGVEEWKAAYVQLAQSRGLLNDDKQAGEQWTAFCERYRKQVGEVVWDYKTADALQTALMLEANAAAPLAVDSPALVERAADPKDCPRVVLPGPGECPTVCGKEKTPLTLPQYDVVKALLEAGERGLSKDELDRKSKRGDARKILKRLAESDADWEAVIHFPGAPGRGYRIG
jgi:hypothetical protein